MNIAVCKLTIRLPENHSLKGKRRIINSICSRVHNKFNVSMAEVDHNDSWQTATLGIAVTANTVRHTDKILSNVMAFLENNLGELVLVSHEQETITGF